MDLVNQFSVTIITSRISNTLVISSPCMLPGLKCYFWRKIPSFLLLNPLRARPFILIYSAVFVVVCCFKDTPVAQISSARLKKRGRTV